MTEQSIVQLVSEHDQRFAHFEKMIIIADLFQDNAALILQIQTAIISFPMHTISQFIGIVVNEEVRQKIRQE